MSSFEIRIDDSISYQSFNSEENTIERRAYTKERKASMNATLVHNRPAKQGVSNLVIHMNSFSTQAPFWHETFSETSKAVGIIHEAFDKFLEVNPDTRNTDQFLKYIISKYKPYHHLEGFKESIWDALKNFLDGNPNWSKHYADRYSRQLLDRLTDMFESLN